MIKNEILVIENGELTLEKDFAEDLKQFELLVKAIENKKTVIREKLLKAMTDNNITKIENDNLLIYVKKATTKENFDKKQFQLDHPDLYDKYITFGNVKESITIKVKESKDNGEEENWVYRRVAYLFSR